LRTIRQSHQKVRKYFSKNAKEMQVLSATIYKNFIFHGFTAHKALIFNPACKNFPHAQKRHFSLGQAGIIDSGRRTFGFRRNLTLIPHISAPYAQYLYKGVT
jgi:hypothetical protein